MHPRLPEGLCEIHLFSHSKIIQSFKNHLINHSFSLPLQKNSFMSIEKIIQENVVAAVKSLFDENIDTKDVSLQETNKDFKGDLTVVVFPYVRGAKKSPEQTGEMIGKYLNENVEEISSFNVIKGFLNLEIGQNYWLNFLAKEKDNANFGKGNQSEKIVLEYCGPNTNKPLHLGHIRNMLIGYATANLLEYAGNEVHKVNIYNDRGIAICKSMLAWQKFGEGKTPQSEGIKGDHFVGQFYVKFDEHYKKEVEEIRIKIKDGAFNIDLNSSDKLVTLNSDLNDLKKLLKTESKINLASKPYFKDYLNYLEEKISLVQFEKILSEKLRVTLINEFDKKTHDRFLIFEKKKKEIKDFIQEHAEKTSPLIQEARKMLQLWEAGDKETVALWETMNNWVYEGFEETFEALGVDFEKHYKESEYYERGKELVEEGLKNNKFFKKEDGSAWVNLEEDGLDQKLLLRGDGTSVYITQDMGIAEARYNDYQFDQSIYVVANEQDYHFKVLQHVLQKLEKPYADGIYHLSYGMVDLPEGRMKSREGTVVDADDLIQEMIDTAEQHTKELGKIDDLSSEQAQKLFKTLALGALKYFILKVNPRKRVIFNPKDSIDFQGNTGPFVQYAHARIQSLLRNQTLQEVDFSNIQLEESEKELLLQLHKFPQVVELGASGYDVSEIANYVYELARLFNKFYASVQILKVDNENDKQFRLHLSKFTAETIKKSLAILGIDAPNKM